MPAQAASAPDSRSPEIFVSYFDSLNGAATLLLGERDTQIRLLRLGVLLNKVERVAFVLFEIDDSREVGRLLVDHVALDIRVELDLDIVATVIAHSGDPFVGR